MPLYISNFSGDDTAQFIYLGILAVLIGAGVMRMNRGKQQWKIALRNALYWIGIIIFLIGIYVFRFDLMNIGSRIFAGLLPGIPISQQIDGQTVVTIVKSENNHFEVDADINGYNVRFIIDTGASSIVLSYNDARKVGVKVQELHFGIPTQTANGVSYAAIARVDNMRIGEIKRSNVPVLVTMQGALATSLLGQKFLESLSGYERLGDRLILRD